MATYSDLRKAVAGFMNRLESSFVTDSFDVLKHACNAARRSLERDLDLEYSVCEVTVAIGTPSLGGSLTTAVLRGTATAVEVKRVRAAFMTATDSGSLIPIDLRSRLGHIQKQHRLSVAVRDYLETELAQGRDQLPTAYQQGRLVYVSPVPSTAYTLTMEVYRFLPDYTANGDTDFVLDNCFDYLVYSAVQTLNLYLKDDERQALLIPLLGEAKESVRRWNDSLIVQHTNDFNKL